MKLFCFFLDVFIAGFRSATVVVGVKCSLFASKPAQYSRHLPAISSKNGVKLPEKEDLFPTLRGK